MHLLEISCYKQGVRLNDPVGTFQFYEIKKNESNIPIVLTHLMAVYISERYKICFT